MCLSDVHSERYSYFVNKSAWGLSQQSLMQKAGEFSYYLEYLICQVTFAYPQTSNLLCFWARVITLHYIIRLMVGMWNIKRLLPFLYGLKLTSQERERILYESNESVSHESMSQIWKNNIFGRNNKIKHYFYYFVYLLHFCLPARARPISDMKSQPGLFVSSIPGSSAPTTCMAWRIAFPDTL